MSGTKSEHFQCCNPFSAKRNKKQSLKIVGSGLARTCQSFFIFKKNVRIMEAEAGLEIRIFVSNLNFWAYKQNYFSVKK